MSRFVGAKKREIIFVSDQGVKKIILIPGFFSLLVGVVLSLVLGGAILISLSLSYKQELVRNLALYENAVKENRRLLLAQEELQNNLLMVSSYMEYEKIGFEGNEGLDEYKERFFSCGELEDKLEVQRLDLSSKEFLLDSYDNNEVKKAVSMKYDPVDHYLDKKNSVSFLKGNIDSLLSELESVVSSVGLDLVGQKLVVGSVTDRVLVKNDVAEKKVEKNYSLESFNDNIGSHLLSDAGLSVSHQGGPVMEFFLSDNESKFGKKMSGMSVSDKMMRVLLLKKVIASLPIYAPAEGYRITSKFGFRRDPINKKRSFHNAVDLVTSYNGDIISAGKGKVVRARRMGGYGLLVDVDHGHGLTTRYAHMAKLKVKKGDFVEAGDVLGLQGNTGRSVGQHLHYEIRVYNEPIDPLNFMKLGRKMMSNNM